MANILSLAMKVSADASGVVKSLTPAERALENLGKQTQATTAIFAEFAAGNQSAAAAQLQLATDFGFLTSALKTGQITAAEFASEYAKLQEEARGAADAFAEGVRITEQARTPDEQRIARIERLSELLKMGALDEQAYARAVDQANGVKEAAAKMEQERASILERGKQVTKDFLTVEEQRAQLLREIESLLKEGAITDETAARARAEYSGANEEAARLQKKLEEDNALAAKEKVEAERRNAEEVKAIQKAASEEAQRLAKERTEAEKRNADELKKIINSANEDIARITRERAESARVIDEAFAKAKKTEADAAADSTKKLLEAQSAAYAKAAKVIEENLTPQEKYDRQVQELRAHLDEGRLSQEQFSRATKAAKKDLSEAEKSAKKTDSTLEKLNKNVGRLSKIEVGRLIIDGLQAVSSIFTRVSSQVSSLVSSVNTSIDSLNDLSARTGIGVTALQGYSLAAKMAGVDTEQFGAAVQTLGVNIGKATPGDALDKALRGINLSLAELRALSPEQQFSEIGDAISQLPTAADRAAAAVQIFGKQGAALAPLFREGAASIEELQARAERLGIIISETQVNNVADMNDAFDLVAATINGIVGQVIGNLAPAVTAVTEQFLKFVEEWSGAQGEGGTGIANAITDVLLQGAEYFAGIFDKFVENFGSLGESLSYTAEVFDVASKVLLAGSEGIRVAFNAIQIGIDAILIGFGKIIENVGGYLSNDLEEFGKGLAAASQESADRNAREMEAAASNAANTFNSIFTGGNGNAEAAGVGVGQQFIRGLRGEIENARLPEVKVQADLASATADLDQFLSTAEGGTSLFLQQSQATLATFSKMAAEGSLTADQIEIMNGFMENLNGELTKEKQLRQEAADAAAAQAEGDRKRLDQLLQTNDDAARIEQDLLAVQREQARVSEELAAARAADNQAQADAAAQRQGELDQLQAKLEEQQQALEQGFGQGFQAAFAAVDNSINGLIEKSQQFGQAGFDAAVRLQEGIAAAQEQASAGILNQEAFNAEVARQQELFNNELANLQEVERQKKQAADERVRQEEAAQKQQLQAQESYRKQQEKAQQDYAQQQQQAMQAYAEEQRRIYEEQQKAAAAEAKRQEERLRKLNTLGSTTIQATDIRTQQGAALVVELAANQQDPALIQARLQTKLLEQVALGIGQAASNYFRAPVAIVGAAQLG